MSAVVTERGAAISPSFQYHHPAVDGDGKTLSTANIIWAECDQGSAYYRTSKFAMRGGRFPLDHPVAPGNARSNDRAEMGDSPALTAFRARGYWASCFPEGDGITLKWWGDDVPFDSKTREQVIRDINECFPFTVK